MKRYVFRLESVLNYRKNMEKRAQRELFNAQNAYMLKAKTIEQLKDKRETTAFECGKARSKGIDVSMCHVYETYMKRLDHDLVNADTDLKDAEEAVMESISVLKDASIKKKMMETLKTSKSNVYMDFMEKEEQKILDELVLMRRGQKS